MSKEAFYKDSRVYLTPKQFSEIEESELFMLCMDKDEKIKVGDIWVAYKYDYDSVVLLGEYMILLIEEIEENSNVGKQKCKFLVKGSVQLNGSSTNFL